MKSQGRENRRPDRHPRAGVPSIVDETLLKAMTDTDLYELSVDQLVERMDDILREGIRERYGEIPNGLPVFLVSNIIGSQKVAAIQDQQKKRDIAHIAFDYLLQMQLIEVSLGFGNRLIFTKEFDPKRSWASPKTQLEAGVLRQYEIVGSRLAFEIFMDLLYFIEKGDRIKAKRSKIKSFKKWLCNTDNQFHYFAHVLLQAYYFDRQLRTPEVHGRPRLGRVLLRLQAWNHKQLNEPHSLLGALLTCWDPLILLLNGSKPTFMQLPELSDKYKDWHATYMSGSESEILRKLEGFLDDIERSV